MIDVVNGWSFSTIIIFLGFHFETSKSRAFGLMSNVMEHGERRDGRNLRCGSDDQSGLL